MGHGLTGSRQIYGRKPQYKTPKILIIIIIIVDGEQKEGKTKFMEFSTKEYYIILAGM